MRTCASSRPWPSSIPAATVSSLTFTIEEGDRYTLRRRSTSRSNVRDVDPACVAQQAALRAGQTYNAEAVEKIGRGNDDRDVQARLCLRAGASARRSQLRDASDQRRLRDRGGRARLHRAHQHPRQYAHARLRHPARVRYRGRRRLQSRAGRPRRAAAEEPQLLQDRQDHQRARLGARTASSSMSRSKSSRPASSRSRAAIRPRTASSREVSVGERNLLGRGQIARAVGHLRPAHARRRVLVRRAVFPRLPARLRHRPLRQADRRVFVLRLPAGDDRRRLPLRHSAARGSRASTALFGLPAEDRPRSDPAELQQHQSEFRARSASPATYPTTAGLDTTPATTPPPGFTGLTNCYRRRRGVAAVKQRSMPGRRSSRWSATASSTTRSTTTGARPAACSPSCGRISPASAAT